MAYYKHIVTCVECGKSFDVGKTGGHYDKYSHRYTCNSCCRKLKAGARRESRRMKSDERLRRTGMRQTVFQMLLKLFFGVSFLASCFSSEFDKESIIICLVVGGILFLWGIIPFIKSIIWKKKNKKPGENSPEKR